MNEGIEGERLYNETLHLQSLRLLRYGAYISYIAIPTKKGFKKDSITKFYPLPFDPKVKEYSKEEITVFFDTKEPIITNGKLRGYKDKNGKTELLN